MKVDKKLIIFLCSILFIGVFLDCNFAEAKAKKANDKFIVGFDAEFPPYGYKDESGEYVGFDLSLAAEVCKRNDWKLVKQPIDWNSKDLELKSGSIDCIWNGFTMNGRESKYTWSSAYIDNSQVTIVKKGSGIKRLADLAGKVVIVQNDSSALAAFTGENATKENKELASKFKSLQQVSDYNSAFMNLESGVADAICMDVGVASYEVQKRGSEFVMLQENVSSEKYGIGFKLGNKALRNQVEKTLQEMLRDGTFDKIAKEWKLESYVCLGKEGADEVMKNEDDYKKSENIKDMVISTAKQLSGGMLSSLAIFFLTLIISMPLGIVLMGLRRTPGISILAKLYISVMRGTPLMLQLLVVFFGPYYLFGMSLSHTYRFYAVIIGFGLNYTAYFAEIYRGGLESISVGQYEAADVLGYSKAQTFIKIIFPQMIKRVLPPVTNEVITLVKDTSLAYAIAYTEMFTLAKQVASSQASVMPLMIAGVFYYIFNFIVSQVMEYIEKRMSYYQ